MNEWHIKSMLASSPDFERQTSEIWVNNDFIGYISQEIENGPVEIILYKEALAPLPQNIIEEAIEEAKDHLLGDADIHAKISYKIIE